MTYAVAFFCGVFIETAFVFWFRSAADYRAIRTGCLSFLIGGAQVTGLIEVVTSHNAGWFLAIGYGVGGWAAVKLSERRAKQ